MGHRLPVGDVGGVTGVDDAFLFVGVVTAERLPNRLDENPAGVDQRCVAAAAFIARGAEEERGGGRGEWEDRGGGGGRG